MSRVVWILTAVILCSSSAMAQQVADGFDYPVGRPNAIGYYNAQDFRVSRHLGEDWNGVGGGNSDLGDPVYAVAHGQIVYAQNAGPGWGNVIIVSHMLPDGRQVTSMYGHLREILRTSGAVLKGDQIGTIGRGYDYGNGKFDYQNAAHLHFEIRTNTAIGPGPGYSRNASGWTDPSDFIDANRQLGPSCVSVSGIRTLIAGDTLRIRFTVPVGGSPDLLITVEGQTVGTTPLSTTYRLYDGTRLLGSQNNVAPPAFWKSTMSLFGSSAASIDFSTIASGAIDGRLDYLVSTGTQTIDSSRVTIVLARATGASSWFGFANGQISSIEVCR